jgi:hypothetical protein
MEVLALYYKTIEYNFGRDGFTMAWLRELPTCVTVRMYE